MGKSGEIKLRKVTDDDCKILWEWRNEEETRKNSFNQEIIPLDDHRKWFSNILKRQDVILYVAVDMNNKQIGMTRLDIDGKKAEINISIDKNERGKGYGTEILKLISDIGFKELKIHKLIGYIKTNNQKSIKAFLNAGYRNSGIKTIKGNESVEMILEKEK